MRSDGWDRTDQSLQQGSECPNDGRRRPRVMLRGYQHSDIDFFCPPRMHGIYESGRILEGLRGAGERAWQWLKSAL
jgi:hypothetical protein